MESLKAVFHGEESLRGLNDYPSDDFNNNVRAAKLLPTDESRMKMQKSHGGDCDKKPAGNQGEISAAEKSEGNAESPGPEDKSIPRPIKDWVVSRGEKFKLISPKSIEATTFKDVGGLNETKRSLEELVMLPLKRPDLFKGALSKTCGGILLFGPTGTGKTMLARAVANESGASFICCSVSTLTSNVPGEAEKNVRALFDHAELVAPTIIFVDDVDSLLAKQEYVESELMREGKNAFLSSWDGFTTKRGEILVLATTRRPFDLDEAAIRRFEHRMMVGLPSVEGRKEILMIILSKEKTEGIDFDELAKMTRGYTGSDLKNLCNTALRRPVCEFLERERAQEKENSEEGSQAKEDNTEKEEEAIITRPLTMEDMKEARKLVAPCFGAEDWLMKNLINWNACYGLGGSRRLELSYFG